MKLDHTTIFEHVKAGKKVYYATSNGVIWGTPVRNIDGDEFWLIMGSSQAMPVGEHPNQNSPFDQGGYYSDFDEALLQSRALAVGLFERLNAGPFKNIPIEITVTDPLENFAHFMREYMFRSVDEELEEYRTKMSIITPKT